MIQKQLAAGMAMQARLNRQDTVLREGAKQRLATVQDQIDRVRIKAQYDENAAKDYLDLIDERGFLWRALGSASAPMS